MSSFTINILVLDLISVYHSESNTQQVSLTQSQSLIWTPRQFFNSIFLHQMAGQVSFKGLDQV